MTALGWDPFAALNHSTIQILQPRVETNRTKLTSFSRLVLSWVVWTQAQHLLWRHHLRRHCHKKAQMHKITTMMTKFWTTATIQTARALCVFHWPAPKPHPTLCKQWALRVTVDCASAHWMPWRFITEKMIQGALLFTAHHSLHPNPISAHAMHRERTKASVLLTVFAQPFTLCHKKNKDWSATHTEDRLVDAPILNQTKQV